MCIYIKSTFNAGPLTESDLPNPFRRVLAVLARRPFFERPMLSTENDK